MSTSATAAVIDSPKKKFGHYLLSLCASSILFALKHPLLGLWWALRYMPFSGHFLVVYATVMWWFEQDASTVLRFGPIHMTLETAIMMGVAITTTAEITRMALMREQIKLLLIGPVIMGFIYVILALSASTSSWLVPFHSNTFYLVIGLTLFNLLGTFFSGMVITQKSSDIVDSR